VFIVYNRTILPKYLKMKGQQQRPRNRTLTAVHDEILHDLLFPARILGRRTRIRTDGKRCFRVLLDPNDRDRIEERAELISSVYAKMANKNVAFEFPSSRDFPV
jgi:small subunit ribosomal protein S7e